MATSDSAQDSIFDKVAKESDHSGASDHPTHQGKQDKPHAHHHQSKGPQISDSTQPSTPSVNQMDRLTVTVCADLPEAKDKEELKAKAQEMNDHVSK
jgi:hypothetical protein